MKRLLFGVALLLGSYTTRAQAVRYANRGHVAIESQPGMGYELPAYLGAGDSVQVVSNPPTDNPQHLGDRTRKQFTYVSYPAYRGQAAGQGWVISRCLVSTRDSSALPTAAVPAQTWTSTQTVTTKRYVPVTEASQPYATGGKVVHTIATGKATPRPVASASGAVVYYCNSGNTVKYHASPTCRGLHNCGASVVKMSLRQAQQEMDPCKFCY